jgi:hypothetical protein
VGEIIRDLSKQTCYVSKDLSQSRVSSGTKTKE